MIDEKIRQSCKFDKQIVSALEDYMLNVDAARPKHAEKVMQALIDIKREYGDVMWGHYHRLADAILEFPYKK